MSTDKLELKHIAPYLPYKLKIYYELVNDRNQLDWELNCIHVDILLMNQNKPMLRPLLDLVKPCLPDGATPIIELAKINNPNMITLNDVYSDGNKCFSCQHILKTSYRDLIYTFTYNAKLFGFFNGERFNGKCDIVNHLYLFEKLFEWHFDVFGLIGKGLAIDINTIEK